MLTPNLSLKFQREVWPVVRNPPNPVLSPQFADLRGMPPTFFLTSVRDLLLSGTVNLHRAFVHAGVDAQLIVFDGLPHAFWTNFTLPESVEANKMVAEFFDGHLGRRMGAPGDRRNVP